MKACVFGCGSWGIALAATLEKNGHEVSMWSYTEEAYDELMKTRRNESLLPGVTLAPSIRISTDESIASGQDLVVLAVPSYAVEATAKRIVPHLKPGAVVVNVAKGLDRNHGFQRFSETLAMTLKKENPVVVLTGPTHAEEVARFLPTAILAASRDDAAAALCRDAFMNGEFRVYTSHDVVGAELGGAFKNIIALAAGICDGMGYGDNTKAALMTRGLTEIAHLGVTLGANRETFAGLSGVGDLIVTCTSMHSRNRRAGILIGEGMSVDEAMEEVGAVVEGYYATEAGYKLSRQTGIDMPIVDAVYRVLYEHRDAHEMTEELMNREKRAEIESVWIDSKEKE